MSKASPVFLVVAAVAIGWAAWAHAQSNVSSRPSSRPDSEDRVAAARRASSHLITGKYKEQGVKYPGEIHLRWLKREAILELWARNGGEKFRLIGAYPILLSSGSAGPKRRQGDYQVPEGFYEIDRFNPKSNFHLSLGLNYPNAADRVHADPQRPGGDIFIHGSNVSVGCAPLGDEAIEEVYLAAKDAHSAGQEKIAVHIFPARMAGPEWEAFAAEEIADRPELAAFWKQLKPGYEYFESHRQVPKISITRDGRYVLKK